MRLTRWAAFGPAALLLACSATEPEPEIDPPEGCAEDRLEDARSGDCVPEACGSADFPSADGLHVAPWGDDGAEGTADDPLATLDAAMEQGEPVVLSGGTWAGALDPIGDLHITGRCSALTVLDAEGEDAPALRFRAGTLHVQGLTLRGGRIGAQLQAEAALVARLEDVFIDSPSENGLVVTNFAEVTLENVRIESVRPGPEGRAAGMAVALNARVDARGLTVRDVDHLGVGVFGDAVLTLEDGWIGEVRWVEDAPQPSGSEIAVQTGGVATVTNTKLAGPGPIGGFAGTGSRLEVVDSQVSGHNDPWGLYGLAALGGEVVVDGGLVADNQPIGIYAESGQLTLTDVEVRGTTVRFDAPEAAGIWLAGSSRLDAVGVDVHHNTQYGLVAYGSGNDVFLNYSQLHDNLPDERGVFGCGVAMVCLEGTCDSTLGLEGVDLVGNHHAGLRLAGQGIEGTAVLGTIADTLPSPTFAAMGWGVVVDLGARLYLGAIDVAGSSDLGIGVSNGAHIDVVNSSVRDTRLVHLAGGGSGLAVGSEATATVDNSIFSDNAGPGLYVGSDGVLDAQDVLVERSGFAGVVNQGGVLHLRDSDILGVGPHPSRGGGVGVFAASAAGYEARLTVDVLAVTDLAGPAAYLRGEGAFELDHITAARTGNGSGAPGLLFASGIGAWDGAQGLRMADSGATELAGPGILLDDASALIESTSLEEPVGPPLIRQNCETSTEPLGDLAGWDTTCQPFVFDLGPPLTYDLGLHEVGISR